MKRSNYTSRATHYSKLRFPKFLLLKTPYSTRLFVSRNGICLERIASFSVQGKLFLCVINYSRLIFWLKKGVRVDDFLHSHVSHNSYSLIKARHMTILQNDL